MRTTAEQRAAYVTHRSTPSAFHSEAAFARSLVHDLDDAIRENERLSETLRHMVAGDEIFQPQECLDIPVGFSRAIRVIAALRDQLRWRKCEEELPEESHHAYDLGVHVFDEWGQHHAWYRGGVWIDVGGFALKPTHWRPLGPGPEEGK